MKKHIIFKGKRGTGKSLFSKIIFSRKNTLWVNGRMFPESSFLFDSGIVKNWDFENIVIDDLRNNFNIEEVYHFAFADTMIINRQFRDGKIVKTPRFIFILNSEVITLPEDKASFNRRFHVFDFDKDPISDLMKIIYDEKIIIKTAP